MAGTPGPQGKVFSPIYNELTGELSWELTDGTEPIKPVVIKGKDDELPNYTIELDSDTARQYLVKYIGEQKEVVGEINSTAVRWEPVLPPVEQAKNYKGQIVVVETDGDEDNDYLEYIAVKTGDSDSYKWELLGGSGLSNAQITEITENIINVENKIDNIEGDINTVEQSVNNLTTQVNTVNTTVTNNTSNITNLNSKVEEINTDIANFEARIDNLENTPAGNAPLKEVRLTGQQLEFVYITESGEQVVTADISDIITNEEVGAGLQEQNGSISVKIAHDDEYLMLSDEGLSVKGLDTKFEAVNQELTNISQEITEVKEIVQQVENIDGGEIQWQ